MASSKIIILHAQNFYKKQLKKIVREDEVKKWFFLGGDATIPFDLEETILKNHERISISKELSKNQYENFDDYIDFIDNHENETGGELWWASWLSWKNPWISNFYLSVSQLEVFNVITQKQLFKNNNVLVVVEDYALFTTLKSNYNNTNSEKYYFYSYRLSLNLKIYFLGVINRLLALPFALRKKNRYKKIFRSVLYNIDHFLNHDLIIIPTFIDERSFRLEGYNDPFMGKILKQNILGSRQVLIVPIVVSASNEQLNLFNTWLKRNKFSVHFLPNSLTLIPTALYCLRQIFIRPKMSKNQFFLNKNISKIINSERIKDWSAFDLTNHFIKRFVTMLSQNKKSKTLIYPFENQKWERIFLYELRKLNEVYSIGIQNAPCPKLSTRFYISKKLTNQFPLPTVIIATGNISYKNINEYYGQKVKVIESFSARSFISNTNDCGNSSYKNVMVGCSLGTRESVELITIIISAFNNIQGYTFNIVPHPLIKYNYSNLLKKLNAPDHIKLSSIGFNEELKRSDFILFDSSTVGLEGMLNGVIPIYVGHECSIHVNPNEYDNIITKYAYNTNELIIALEDTKFNYELANQVSMKYFGDNKSFDLEEIIIKLLSASNN